MSESTRHGLCAPCVSLSPCENSASPLKEDALAVRLPPQWPTERQPRPHQVSPVVVMPGARQRVLPPRHAPASHTNLNPPAQQLTTCAPRSGQRAPQQADVASEEPERLFGGLELSSRLFPFHPRNGADGTFCVAQGGG